MSQSPNSIVTDFYNAISAGDPDTIGKIIDTCFAEDATIEWPPSLPHGGRVQGSRKLRAIFAAAADPDAKAGAKNLKLIRAIGDGDEIVAWVTFDWVGGSPNEALEMWTFADGKVRSIRAFYWDAGAVSA